MTFLLLIGIGIAVLVIFLVNVFSAPVDASNEFLHHLRDRQYQAATAQLCNTSPYQSARALAAKLEADGPIKSYDLNQSETTNDTGSVGGTIDTGPKQHQILLTIAKEHGSWKVCDATLDVAFPETPTTAP